MAMTTHQREYALKLLKEERDEREKEIRKETKWSLSDEQLYNANMNKDRWSKVQDFTRSDDKSLPHHVTITRETFAHLVNGDTRYSNDNGCRDKVYLDLKEEVEAHYKSVAAALNERRTDRIECLKKLNALNDRYEKLKTEVVFGKDAAEVMKLVRSL